MNNHGRKHVFTFFGVACILSLCLPAFLQFSTAAVTENLSVLRYEVSNVFVGDLTHTIQISNPSISKVAGGMLVVPVIRNETARHYAILYNVSSPTGQPTILNDDSGNTYACWTDIEIDGKQTVSIELDYHVLSFDTNYLINSTATADYDRNSDLYKKYTQPEELIESDNGEIASTAQTLASKEKNAQEKASKTYNFVIDHLQYEPQEEERGAVWALKNRVGDCSEYSYLFVALCRAAGIPARVQAGFAFNSLRETLQDGHMWAEYYLESYGWVPVDATWLLFDAMDYRHFNSLQSMSEAIPYANYIFNNTVGPEPNDEQTVKLARTSPTAFSSDSFAENTIGTAQKIKQARFALLISRFLGAQLIFPSETDETSQTLLESQIYLQNIIDSWENNPHIAQSNIASAFETAEKASQGAWILVSKALALLVGVSMLVLLVASVIMKRRQTSMKANSTNHIVPKYTILNTGNNR
jgi:hypothetical protein